MKTIIYTIKMAIPAHEVILGESNPAMEALENMRGVASAEIVGVEVSEKGVNEVGNELTDAARLLDHEYGM